VEFSSVAKDRFNGSIMEAIKPRNRPDLSKWRKRCTEYWTALEWHYVHQQ
jgi:hypothetical protein